MFSSLRQSLASGRLPYGARLAVIAIALLNLPAALFGGLFFWTILPLPGLLIYAIVLGLAFNQGSRETALKTSIAGLIYNLMLSALLMTMVVEKGLGGEFWGPLSLISFTLGTAGLYGIVLNVLKEEN